MNKPNLLHSTESTPIAKGEVNNPAEEIERDLKWIDENRPTDWEETFDYRFTSRGVELIFDCEPPKEVIEELKGSSRKFDFTKDMVFDTGAKTYWVVDNSRKWIPANESQARRILKTEYKETDDKAWSADYYLDEVHRKQNVAFAGSMSGYRIGKHNICGKNVLITDEANFLTPKQIAWPTIGRVIGSLFLQNKEEEEAQSKSGPITQLDHFLSWLQVSVWALYVRRQLFLDGSDSYNSPV